MTIPTDFSPEFRDLLRRAGWAPGRQVDTVRWVSELRREGFSFDHSAVGILGSIGGLFVPLPAAGISPYDHELQFEPLLAASGEHDRVEDWEDALGIRLSPLGREIRTGNVIWAGDDGRFYYGLEFGLYLLGDSLAAAMDRLAFPLTPLGRVAE